MKIEKNAAPTADTWSHWQLLWTNGDAAALDQATISKSLVSKRAFLIVYQIIQALHCFKNHIRLCTYVHFLQSWWARQLWNQTSLQWSWQSLEVLIAEGAHTMLHHEGDISNFLHWRHKEGGPLTTCRQVWNNNKCTLKPSNFSTGHGSKILTAKEGLGTNLACNQVKKMHW